MDHLRILAVPVISRISRFHQDLIRVSEKLQCESRMQPWWWDVSSLIEGKQVPNMIKSSKLLPCGGGSLWNLGVVPPSTMISGGKAGCLRTRLFRDQEAAIDGKQVGIFCRTCVASRHYPVVDGEYTKRERT